MLISLSAPCNKLNNSKAISQDVSLKEQHSLFPRKRDNECLEVEKEREEDFAPSCKRRAAVCAESEQAIKQEDLNHLLNDLTGIDSTPPQLLESQNLNISGKSEGTSITTPDKGVRSTNIESLLEEVRGKILSLGLKHIPSVSAELAQILENLEGNEIIGAIRQIDSAEGL